jgi:hypothetical protein
MANQQPLVSPDHPLYWKLRFVVAAALDILNVEVTDPKVTKSWSDEARADMRADAQMIFDLIHKEALDE